MTIKNNLLGGTDFATPTARIKPTDLNDTNNAIIEAGPKSVAQVPFTTLKATGEWVNEGHLASDRFTNAAGVNGTVNTGESTALCPESAYILKSEGVLESGFTISNPDSFTNTSNIYDGDYSTFASRDANTTVTLGYTFSSRLINTISFDVNIISISVNDGSYSISLQTYNGSTWTTVKTYASVVSLPASSSIRRKFLGKINSTIQGYRIVLTTNRVGFFNVYQLNSNFQSGSMVFIDTNTLTLNGTESFISVYNSATIPADTSMKIQLSDETKTISAVHTLSANQTTLIPITTPPTADDVLKMTFTLETTDPTITPVFTGFGVSKN